MTMVTANCLKSSPFTPPMNATGTNTAQSTRTIAISALATCRIARSAASRAEIFSCAMMRSTFSITTIASLMDIFRMYNPRKVPITLTGTASIGMSVARQLCRNRNTTSVTSSIASASVTSTSLIDAVTNGVVSNGILYVIPLGKVFCNSSMRAPTAFRTASAFAPGRV